MRAALFRFAGATIVISFLAAAVFRTLQKSPAFAVQASIVFGWLTVTALAVCAVGLLVALVTGHRRDSIYRDLDPAMIAEMNHRRDGLRAQSHERQRP